MSGIVKMKRYLMVIAMVFFCSCNRSPKPDEPLFLTETHMKSDDIAYEAWQVLLGHLDRQEGDDYHPLVKALPQHWRAVYTAFWLECEVNNGGHHQFLWNSGGVLNIETLEDLKYIKAGNFSTIFASALEVYSKHDYQGEKKSGNTVEDFTEGYKEERFDECDNRFYKESEKQTLADILSKHIIENKPLYMKENIEPEN